MDRRFVLRGFGVATAAQLMGVPLADLGAAAEPVVAEPDPSPSRRRVLSGRVSLTGLTVAADEIVELDPAVTTTVECSGNVVVGGILRMRPRPDVTHTLRFVGVDESRVVGGGHEPLASDVGLWVVDDGQLDLVGADKTAWTRLAGSVARDASAIDLQAAPAGWRVGDELQIVPTQAPTVGPAAWTGYSAAAVASLAGARVGLSAPTAHPHPMVNDRWSAEVLNLSRNVRVEGTPGGRAHIMVTMARRPQTIRNVRITHMGPKAGDTGRYGLHFHLCGDASRGSLVEGVVVTQCGNHSFVPHTSHGITFRDCIAHDVQRDAYWWDLRRSGTPPPPPIQTHDTVWDRCVASKVLPRGGENNVTLTGFLLGDGNDNTNVVRGCVAVGVDKDVNTSGFNWPARASTPWVFEDSVAHNCGGNGSFVWQNHGTPTHLVARFLAYHNAAFGLEDGAYRNAYVWEDPVLYGNLAGGIQQHAQSNRAGGGRKRYVRPVVDGAGFAPHAVAIAPKHNLSGDEPVEYRDARFFGHTGRAVLVELRRDRQPTRDDFVDCNLTPDHFKVVSLPAGSVIRVQDNGKAFQITPSGVRTIPAFA